MKKFKKHLRVIGLIIFIAFAAVAGGMFGIPLNSVRQDDPEKPRIEMVDKLEEDDDEEDDMQEEQKKS